MECNDSWAYIMSTILDQKATRPDKKYGAVEIKEGYN
jgi:hypothetical protein